MALLNDLERLANFTKPHVAKATEYAKDSAKEGKDRWKAVDEETKKSWLMVLAAIASPFLIFITGLMMFAAAAIIAMILAASS